MKKRQFVSVGRPCCGFSPVKDGHGLNKAQERMIEVRLRMSRIKSGNRGQLPSIGGYMGHY